MAKGKSGSKAGARGPVGIKCSKCGKMTRRHTEKGKNTTDKLEVKKYCPFCRSVQVFNETKIGK